MKLQDEKSAYRDQFHSYTPTMKYLKRKQNNPIHNNIKNNELIRINLTKKIKDTYTENRKTLMKVIDEDPNKQKTSLSWIGKN